jgi:hypothetical protein
MNYSSILQRILVISLLQTDFAPPADYVPSEPTQKTPEKHEVETVVEASPEPAFVPFVGSGNRYLTIYLLLHNCWNEMREYVSDPSRLSTVDWMGRVSLPL